MPLRCWITRDPHEWAICKLHANQRVYHRHFLVGGTLVGPPAPGLVG